MKAVVVNVMAAHKAFHRREAHVELQACSVSRP